MKHVLGVLVLSMLGSAALAMSPVEKLTTEVQFVDSAVFSTPFTFVQNSDGSFVPEPVSLTVSYSTGGCGESGHVTNYRLEKIAAKESENLMTFKVHVYQTLNGGCRMAYKITDRVNLKSLLEAQAARLGVKLEELKKESVSVRFVAPDVAGFVLFGN